MMSRSLHSFERSFVPSGLKSLPGRHISKASLDQSIVQMLLTSPLLFPELLFAPFNLLRVFLVILFGTRRVQLDDGVIMPR